MKFEDLVNIIKETDNVLKQRALVAVNISITIRNWLTGFYIVEFEQNGDDRAKYGEKLLQKLANELKGKQLKGYSFTNLLQNRQFYKTYPKIVQIIENKHIEIYQTVSDKLNHMQINQTASDKLKEDEYLGVPIVDLVTRLSFSHLLELIKLDDPLKRAFYEIECIKSNWSVRELQRQIGSLLFERTGLSTNKEKMIELANKKASQFLPEDIIRDPYIFEFLGLKQHEVVPENKLEDLLIIHLQEFLLELGKGFCFEARQKRITIDNRHYYIDLVFYHKILKCNVIIELKTRDFEHADASQLKVYLNYWKKYEMQTDDNPPVGILLCTGKNDELVEFATAGDEQLFISKYKVELPTVDELKTFIRKELAKGY